MFCFFAEDKCIGISCGNGKCHNSDFWTKGFYCTCDNGYSGEFCDQGNLMYQDFFTKSCVNNSFILSLFTPHCKTMTVSHCF